MSHKTAFVANFCRGTK